MAENHIGKVVQVIGPVVDIKFDADSLPNIYNEIKIDMGGHQLVVEVEQHIGDDIVRTISMESTDGLRRGMKAVDTGKSISVPVGEKVLGRLIKCGKTVAALINALAYGLYTYIIVLTNCDLPMLAKCLIVASANFVGVWVVKYFEEKARKDKLWKVEATVLRGWTQALHEDLVRAEIPHNYLENVGKYALFNVYCETQAQSAKAKKVLDIYSAKYFVSESKTL